MDPKSDTLGILKSSLVAILPFPIGHHVDLAAINRREQQRNKWRVGFVREKK